MTQVGKEDLKIGHGNSYINLVGFLKFPDPMNSLAWLKKKKKKRTHFFLLPSFLKIIQLWKKQQKNTQQKRPNSSFTRPDSTFLFIMIFVRLKIIGTGSPHIDSLLNWSSNLIKIENSNRIERRVAEIRAILNNLMDSAVVLPIISHFIPLVWPIFWKKKKSGLPQTQPSSGLNSICSINV